MSEAEQLERLTRRVDRRRATVAQGDVEKRRLKWFVVLAVTTWPLGLIWNLWIAAWIFTGWLTFFCVGYYTNFFHRRRARASLHDAERELSRLRDET